MDGVARCSRYSFGPNRLHLCGPDANQEVLDYIKEGYADAGLENILKQFRTLFPYLKEIARENRIPDPFDDRVVEAYWIGNGLLNRIAPHVYHRHLLDVVGIRKTLSQKQRDVVKEKLSRGAVMHHSFHVLNIWKRDGHGIDALDKCCVTWGEVKRVSGPVVTVVRKPIIEVNGMVQFGEQREERIIRLLEHSSLLDTVRAGDRVSMHWGVLCEIISPKQTAYLETYTNRSIHLFNQSWRRRQYENAGRMAVRKS